MLEKEHLITQRRLPWPKRFDVTLLSFLAVVIGYFDRVNISVAAPSLMQEYRWDIVQMGWVLSGFFMGYTLFMIPAGILADRYGSKRVFAASMTWWSVFTALTPLPKSLAVLVFIRSLVGAGQSAIIPSTNSILVKWFPHQEYARATGFCWSGGYAGPIFALPLASIILQTCGWRWVFLAFAGLGAIWLPLWLLGVSNKPETYPSISEKELVHIVTSRPQVQSVKSRVPWTKILGRAPFWAVLVLHLSSNWYYYLIVSWLPTYLAVERHFSLANMTIGSTLPYVSSLLGANLWGSLIDHSSRRRNSTRVRKLFLLPFACASGTLLLLPFTFGPLTTAAVLCLSMALFSSATPVYASGSIELAPRYAGTVAGIQNCFANLSGILVPVVVGYAVKAGGWNAAFWVTSAVGVAGVLSFLLFGRTEKLVD